MNVPDVLDTIARRVLLSPHRSVPGRTCRRYFDGDMSRTPGAPVVLSWPVLSWCPAARHNTREAGLRKRNGKCICPRTRELVEAGRLKDNAARLERYRKRQAAGIPRPSEAKRKTWVPPVLTGPLPAEASVMPACRIKSLGGPLPDEYAADFHMEDTGTISEAARARAKSICAACPLRRPCLVAAVERDEPRGIWGGLTAYQRHRPGIVAATLRDLESAS